MLYSYPVFSSRGRLHMSHHNISIVTSLPKVTPKISKYFETQNYFESHAITILQRDGDRGVLDGIVSNDDRTENVNRTDYSPRWRNDICYVATEVSIYPILLDQNFPIDIVVLFDLLFARPKNSIKILPPPPNNRWRYTFQRVLGGGGTAEQAIPTIFERVLTPYGNNIDTFIFILFRYETN